jgi:hypothetical protein
VGLHDQPRDGETESPAAFAALLWRPTRAPRIEFGGARYKLAQISERASYLVSRRAPRPFDIHESRFDLSFVFELSEACVAPRLAVSRNFSKSIEGGLATVWACERPEKEAISDKVATKCCCYVTD